MTCSAVTSKQLVSYKEEIIRDQCVFGLRCKDTQAKILALGKGLPTVDEVLTKAEAEEQAQLLQKKLAKGMTEAETEVSAVDIDKDKTGVSKQRCRHEKEDKDDEAQPGKSKASCNYCNKVTKTKTM